MEPNFSKTRLEAVLENSLKKIKSTIKKTSSIESNKTNYVVQRTKEAKQYRDAVLDEALALLRNLLPVTDRISTPVLNSLQKEYLRVFPEDAAVLHGGKPSLLFQAQTIIEQISTHKKIHLNHSCPRSQILQLILGLIVQSSLNSDNNQQIKNIVLLTSESLLPHYAYFLQNTTQHLSTLCRDIPQLTVLYYEKVSEVAALKIQGAYTLVICDQFMCPPSLTLPSLLHIFSKIKDSQLLLYSDKAPSSLSPQSRLGLTQIKIQTNYPVEIGQLSDNSVAETILQIVRESKLHNSKIDIVVFAPLSQQTILHLLTNLQPSKSVQTPTHKLILSNSDKYEHDKCNIFISNGPEELARWGNHPLDHLVSVFDYSYQRNVFFDSTERVFKDCLQTLSKQQAVRRLAFLGSLKPGKYFRVENKNRPRKITSLFDNTEDLAGFVVKMIGLGKSEEQIIKISSNVDDQNRLKVTLETLRSQSVLINDNEKIVLSNSRMMDISVHPTFSALFMKHSQEKGICNLLAYVYAAMLNTRPLHEETLCRKMDPIWRETGEFVSYAKFLYTYDRVPYLLGVKKQEQYREEDYESEMFGAIFEDIIPDDKGPITSRERLLEKFRVKRSVVEACMEKVYQVRNSFCFEFQNINQTLDELTDKLVNSYFDHLKLVSVYTGSRRLGYSFGSKANPVWIQPSKTSLLNILNERPHLLIPLKLSVKEGGIELLASNKLSEESFLTYGGQDLPPVSNKSSFGDAEVQFSGVPTALFETLWKAESTVIQQFESKHKCMVEPNPEVGSIIIFCAKSDRENVNRIFNDLLEKNKKELVTETKMGVYGDKKILFQKGGSLRELLSEEGEKQLRITNLAKDVTQQDIRQLLEDYAQVEKIQMDLVDNKTGTRSAVITFKNKAEMFDVMTYLNLQEYRGRQIRFENYKQEDDKVVAESGVTMMWYAWKSLRRGKICFKTEESAAKAEASMTTFDGAKVKIKREGNVLELENLNQLTDETFLQNSLRVYGEILDIQIEKKSMPQNAHPEALLDFYIKDHIPKNEKYHIASIEKKAQGLRVATIKLKNIPSIQALCDGLNHRTKIIGQSRLYVKPYYTHPFLIPKSLEKLSLELVEYVYGRNKNLKAMTEHYTKYFPRNNKFYLVVQSSSQGAFNLFVKELNVFLKQDTVVLANHQKKAILCDIGIKSLHVLERKHQCKFTVDAFKEQLKVICHPKQKRDILIDVRLIPEEKHTLAITLSLKTYRQITKYPQRITEFKEKYELANVQVDNVGKSLILEGNINKLQKARNNVSFFIEAVTNTPQQGLDPALCGICCDELNRPYRLQLCGHCFCLQCLMFSVNTSLNDVTAFPVRCPHCMEDIAVSDLRCLLDDASWNKITNIAVNIFVNRNSDKYVFCFTPNCKGIHAAQTETLECQICEQKYCCACKGEKHPGLSCQQAKVGQSALLKKFMEENDVRMCPNPTCKMLIQRIDGCYRVTCSKCQQSICWKCPKDKMPIYKTADECYRHLNEKHQGYW